MLAGELGEKYGTHHEYYNLRTPADAIKLLCVNHPKLQKDLVTAHQNGVGYKLIQSGAAMGYDELHLPFGSKPMMLVPVISGSGGASTGQILLGVGLVAAAVVFAPAGAGFLGAGLGVGSSVTATTAGGFLVGLGTSSVLSAGISTAIGAIGASMILGGVANLISPQPELPKLGSRRMDGTNFRGPGPQGVTRGASGQQSYAYTGPANTVGNGATIPVVYGRAMLGGHMLSVAVEATDTSDPIATAIKAPGRQTILINGSEVEREFNEESGIATKRLDSRDVFKHKTSIDNRRKVISSSNGFGPGLNKSLSENSEQGFGSVDTKVKYEDEFDVLFEIDRGLYGRAGKGENATKIDGFIQYRIEVIHSLPGKNSTVAVAENTIQGYLEDSQEYYWAQRLKWRRLENNEQLELRITIMDVDTDAPTKFRVHAFGYDLA
ncbi:hypothetical protein [uncultured phage MedDCM-OCT-S01-C58]|nr:hypothetical protein [uncultured phage MedDCM-OCT-S01-C58]